MTFRLIFLLACLAFLPTVAGCDAGSASASGGASGSAVAERSFTIGTIREYQRPGVDGTYARSHGVYLVSNHGMLVALAAECTNPDHSPTAVRYDDVAGIYRCTRCGAKYTRNGLNIGESMTTRPLERCRLRNSGPIYDPQTHLMVDPGKRFRQEDNQWSQHTSYFPLDEVDGARGATRRERARQQELAPLDR